MDVVLGDDYLPEMWDVYKKIIVRYDKRAADFEFVGRYEFYERAKKAYAVIAIGEMARYANII